MAELQAIKRRLRSVSNTRQITKAMQLVSASKLRRAQAAAEAPKPYLEAIRELIARSTNPADAVRHPFFHNRPVKRILAIVVAADRGLAGAYNNNVFRELARLDRTTSESLAVITVGKRGAGHLARVDTLDEIAAYEMDQHEADTGLARPILTEASELFLSGKVDQVQLISTRFHSSSLQTVESTQLLPLPVPELSATGAPTTEPEAEDVVEAATTRLLEAEVYQAIVEARASEQAARMLAMMNATDNASDLIDDLTLARNNARQAAITQELAEISGGAEAVNNS